jgi:hypothetical protein
MTPEEYEERSKPVLDMISMLQRRHEEELKPWYERLYKLNAVYMPPLMVPASVWERLRPDVNCNKAGTAEIGLSTGHPAPTPRGSLPNSLGSFLEGKS